VNSPASLAGHHTSGRVGAQRSGISAPAPGEIPVLLVGAGRRGLSAHVPALRAAAGMRLAAIVETPERVAELGTMPDLPASLHDSVDSALAAGPVRMAIVATPHDSHAPLALRLLTAHIPTLLEKPPARTCDEFSQLRQASRDNGTPLATILTLHYQSRFRDFMKILRSPGLRDARVRINAQVPSWPGVGSWRQSRERAGGGVLIDLGYHYLELIVTCLGRPDTFSVRLRAQASAADVEDQVRASLYFAARGVTVEISLRSGIDLARHSEVMIATDREHIVADSGRERPASGEPPRPGHAQPPTAAINQLTSLVAAGFLDGGGNWRRPLARQAKVLALVDRMYAEAEYVTEISDRVLV